MLNSQGGHCRVHVIIQLVFLQARSSRRLAGVKEGRMEGRREGGNVRFTGEKEMLR